MFIYVCVEYKIHDITLILFLPHSFLFLSLSISMGDFIIMCIIGFCFFVHGISLILLHYLKKIPHFILFKVEILNLISLFLTA
jgi:hypothetical protein